jgi:hypothetical protein
MSVRNQLKLLVGGLSARRGSRPPTSPVTSAMGEFMERSRLIAAVIFIVTVTAIVVISSAGVSTLNAPVLVNEVATSRITALVPFTYQSAERTRAAREQLLDRLRPFTGSIRNRSVASKPPPRNCWSNWRNSKLASPPAGSRRARGGWSWPGSRTRSTVTVPTTPPPRTSRPSWLPATPRRGSRSSTTGSPRCAIYTPAASPIPPSAA